MDLEDKLKLLRKEREARRRTAGARTDAAGRVRSHESRNTPPPGRAKDGEADQDLSAGREAADHDVESPAANDPDRGEAADHSHFSEADHDGHDEPSAPDGSVRRSSARRSRGRTVEETWRNIETGEEDLSVKEKLERLIRLTGTGRPERRAPDPASDPGHEIPAPGILDPLDSKAASASSASTASASPFFTPGRRPAREPFQFLVNPFRLTSLYGRIPIALGLEVPGDVLAFLGRDGLFEALDLSTALFLDLETTGLAGGTGTVPFLVGLGYYRDDRFHVAQFFLNDLAEEERMIRELARFFVEMGFRSVVTYNGKAFDLPILETRFILHRSRFPLAELPHLDFLFPARSLWRHKHDSCRLFHLAQQIVEAPRDEDIPGAEIPLRYFQFIRTGDFSLIEPILYHNQEDILSLLGVVVAGSLLVAKGQNALESGAADALDLFGLAKLFEGAGQIERSAALMQQALEIGLRGEISGLARKKLSVHFKKTRDWSKAVSLWQGAGAEEQIYCCRELAMYFEHREKNFEEAIRAAEEGLALSLDRMSALYRRDFEHRLERLRRKMRRLENGTSRGPSESAKRSRP